MTNSDPNGRGPDEPLYSFEEDGRRTSPDVGEFLLVALARSRWWIAAILLLTVLVGFGVTLARPNEYVSTGKLQLRTGARELRTPESTVDGEFTSSDPGIQDEMELLGDPQLLARLADQVGVHAVLEPYDPAATDGESTPALVRAMHRLQSWWFKRGHPGADPTFDPGSAAAKQAAQDVLAANLETVPARNSNVIHVTYTSQSPQLSQRVVAAFLSIAKQKHLEHYSMDTGSIEALLAQAEDNVDRLETDFDEYRRTCGITDLTTTKAMIAESLVNCGNELHAKSLELDDVRTELKTIAQQIGGTKQTMERMTVPEPLESPKFASLQQHKMDLEKEFAEFRTTFKEGSPGYAERILFFQEEIARFQKEIDDTPQYIQGEPRLMQVPNPHYDELISRQSELERRERSLVEVLNQSRGKQQSLQEEWGKVRDCESTFLDFESRLEHARETRDERWDDLERAKLLGFFDRDESTLNLTTVHEATLPLAKDGPDRLKGMLIALVLGVFLGCGFAVLRQMLDRRVRYRGSVERMLGVPVLGVVPEEPRWKRIGTRARRLALPSPRP